MRMIIEVFFGVLEVLDNLILRRLSLEGANQLPDSLLLVEAGEAKQNVTLPAGQLLEALDATAEKK